ncbi:MAG: type III restriction-modification system endonuclease, partial [Prevotella sp.]|nr:type III restriction-modification system endonuclease [Prevotella sp.]
VLQNIRREQNKNTLPLSDAAERMDIMPNTYQLSVSMETGVGKTFTYIKTIYELNQRYGWTKFVIVVPSIAIREGVLKTFQITERTFSIDYGKTANVFVYNSDDLQAVERFATSSDIQVMIINTQAFNSNSIMMKEQPEKLNGRIPVNIIATTRPVMILDEPQEIDGNDQGQIRTQLARFNPMMMLRYSATHKDYYNLVYSLDSVDAFNMKLVKKISVIGVEGDFSHFQIKSIEPEMNGPVAKVKMFKQGKNGITNSTVTLKDGDNLYEKSGEMERYRDYNNARIDARDGSISFDNGTKLFLNEEQSSEAVLEIRTIQIQKTIQAHLDKEEELFSKGIKVLSLFFIDHVVNYRNYETADQKGKYADIFEKQYAKLVEDKIKELGQLDTTKQDYIAFLKKSLENVSAVHSGYFAQDKKGHFSDRCVAETGEAKKDASEKAAFDLIMRDKEKLLSQEEPVRFIFSHSALKEGWDNPNVFTICKLRSSGSEISKLQEVGRGLRLPVDSAGNRISDSSFMLNYIVDFTEKDFANKLVAEINGELDADQKSPLSITAEDIIKVAEKRNIEVNKFFIELMTKGYVDFDKKVVPEKFDDMLIEYPEFKDVTSGVNTNRIINRNSSRNDKIHIRKARFEELRELWAQLNRKYVLYFDKAIDKKIEVELPSIINDKHVFSLQTVESSRKVLEFERNVAVANEGAHAELTLHDRYYGYNEFLKRASRYTNIPVHILHKAICEAANGGYHLTNEMFNDSSLTRLIGAVDDWKCDQLVGFVRYKQANYTVKETKLTNADGTVKDEVVQAYIGNKSVQGDPPIKYLYDAYAHDSGLELQNIKTEIDEVIVYGKIPSHSICIPTVASSNYSPDFMYVVKKADGTKELNIVIETKAYDKESHISPDEDTKISCAEEFFKAMTANGYTVHFRKQINSTGVKNIIDDLVTG